MPFCCLRVWFHQLICVLLLNSYSNIVSTHLADDKHIECFLKLSKALINLQCLDDLNHRSALVEFVERKIEENPKLNWLFGWLPSGWSNCCIGSRMTVSVEFGNESGFVEIAVVGFFIQKTVLDQSRMRRWLLDNQWQWPWFRQLTLCVWFEQRNAQPAKR